MEYGYLFRFTLGLSQQQQNELAVYGPLTVEPFPATTVPTCDMSMVIPNKAASSFGLSIRNAFVFDSVIAFRLSIAVKLNFSDVFRHEISNFNAKISWDLQDTTAIRHILPHYLHVYCQQYTNRRGMVVATVISNGLV